MNQLHLFELSEKKVNGTITKEELNYLQQIFAENPELEKDFNENIRLIEELNNHAKYKIFVNNLKKAENTYEALKKLNQVSNNIFFRRLIQYSSVAAVSIIAVLTTLYLTGWFNYTHQIKAYKQLSNSITTISKNQKSLWNTLFNSNEITYLRGTAFALSDKGYLITSSHLVSDYDSVLVTNAADSSIRFHAKIVLNDIEHDIAVLKITDSAFANIQRIPYIINFNYPTELGNYVYSLGFSKNSIVFGEGSISSFTGYNEDTNSFQLSIPTNPGNSGSPVFNQAGEIIGIVCGKNFEKEGSSYAVKADILKDIIDSIKTIEPQAFNNNNYNYIKHLPKNKQISKIIPYIFKIEIY
ncbi:MAG: trypsin-like peptidase domain-containing protein [Bacteroidales bacterium]|nr:trypsin-like peptidase domain-containing protein [Bacteroidales bacterium]